MPLKLVKKGKVWHVTGRVNGRRYRKSTRTTNRETAESIRKELERDLEDRAYNHSACFADAVTVYCEKGGERRFLRPLMDQWEGKRLKEITPSEVSAFSLAKYNNHTPQTIRRQLYTPLNAVMRAGHKAGLCPLVIFDPPKSKRTPVRYADDQWMERFIGSAFPRIAITVLFLTLTAARVTEACRLAVGDLDLQRGFAVLRRTKNGKSRRVSLPPILADILSKWLLEQKLFAPTDRVFGYAGRWSVNQAIERVCAKAGIEYIPSHGCGRHAFAARLLAEGKSLKLVQEGGGWGSIQIVAETYGHLEQSHIDEALRETGTGLLTKMGSSVPMLPKPENVGHVLVTPEPEVDLVRSIHERHSRLFPEAYDGGRDRDRTCDPSRVKNGVILTIDAETPANTDISGLDHA